MALRDKLKERAQPLLEPGEQVQQVFPAQSGMNPNLIFVSWLFLLFNKYYTVVATDRAVVVLSASAMRPTFPKAVVMRLPRQTSIGPTSGALWSAVNLPGMPKPVYVHRRFYKDVAAADAGSGWAGGAAAAGAGDAGGAAPPADAG